MQRAGDHLEGSGKDFGILSVINLCLLSKNNVLKWDVAAFETRVKTLEEKLLKSKALNEEIPSGKDYAFLAKSD